MGGPLHQLGVEDIVGLDQDAQEFLVKLLHDMGVVVDAPKEDRLVPQGDARLGQAAAGLHGFLGHFLGVVEVGIQVKGMVLFQHVAELLGDALGHGDGGAAADALHLHVGNLPQLRENPVDMVIREGQGVSPGDQDVPDLLVGPDVVQGLLQFRLGYGLVHLPDVAAALAVAAVHGALVGDVNDQAVRVAPRYIVRRGGELLRHGVVLAVGVVNLVDGGDSLPADGAFGVVGVHQAQIIGRHGPAEPLAHLLNLKGFFGGQVQEFREDIHGGNPVGYLPVPVPPLLLGGLKNLHDPLFGGSIFLFEGKARGDGRAGLQVLLNALLQGHGPV